MVYVYFTARLFKMTGIIDCVRMWHVWGAVVVFIGGCLVLGNWRTDYIAPYTIAMALALLVLFEHFIVLPRWLCRLCVWMAPSMFGVYLLHGPTSFGKLFLAIVIAAVACFLICLVLDLVRRYSLHGIMAICKRK